MNAFKDIFKQKAFIGFLTAGDPTLDCTEQFIDRMIEAGVNLIEIGIPFSDPIAEGRTISLADIRALNGGVTTDKIFDMLSRVRQKHPDFPLVFMTYLNPVFSYGYERFFQRAKQLNMLGIIIPDLPFEERNEVKSIAQKYQQSVISLIAPTSEKRIASIAKEAEGFIYLVSSLGVTGIRRTITTDLNRLVQEIKKYTELPVAVGFGISNPETVKSIAPLCDGIIVGSAIVSLVEKYLENAGDYIYSFCRDMVFANKNA